MGGSENGCGQGYYCGSKQEGLSRHDMHAPFTRRIEAVHWDECDKRKGKRLETIKWENGKIAVVVVYTMYFLSICDTNSLYISV